MGDLCPYLQTRVFAPAPTWVEGRHLDVWELNPRLPAHGGRQKLGSSERAFLSFGRFF